MNKYLGRELVYTLSDGRKLRFSRFTTDMATELRDAALKVLPDPIQRARETLKDFPPHCQAIITEDAIKEQKLRRSLDSDDVQAFCHSPEGSSLFLDLLLRKHQPELTKAQISQILDEIGPREVKYILSVTQGSIPPNEQEETRKWLIERGYMPEDEQPFRPETKESANP